MDSLSEFDPHWFWLALGLLLGAAEMLIPGVFLIWLAGAALITGALAFLLPVGVPLQVVVFAVLSIVAVFTAKRYLRDNPIEPADPDMNKRGARMRGQTGKVTQAIEDGSGRVHIGDTEWIAKGPDVPVGTRVRVVDADGAALVVEQIA
jgi:membrane protein implicated in regulation of membrane protease activity